MLHYALRVLSESRHTLRTWLVVGAVLVVLVSLTFPESWIESGYCLTIFPWIQRGIVSVTGLIPWPLTFTVLVSLPVVWPVLAVRRWRCGRQRGEPRLRLWGHGLLRFARVLLYTAASFLLLWGIGYRRVPIEQRWQLLEQPAGYEQVRDVGLRLLAIIRRDVPKDGVPLDEARAWQAIAAAERQLVRELEGWTPAVPANIKHPPAGILMAAGVYGVCYPWTLEANVDPALPLPIRLAISGHELAHVLGYCGEADANLVSFVAGLRADDALARYGTALSMLRYALGGPSVEDNVWLKVHLPKRARDDLAELDREDKKRTVRVVSRVATKLNNTYLKTQGVELGTADYERGFRLFVHAFQKGMVAMPEPFASFEYKQKELADKEAAEAGEAAAEAVVPPSTVK